MLSGVAVKLASLALLLVLATPAGADSRKHVAVLDFEGPHAANVRGDVLRVAAAKSWVSSSSKLDGRTVRDFALDHEVEVVVQGTVEKRARDYQVRIRFVRGMTGQTIVRTNATLRRPSLDRAALRRIERDLVRALAALREVP